MKIRVERRIFNKTSTLGKMFIDDVFFAYTLEDIVRDLNENHKLDADEKKVYGETAIPYGKYKVTLSYSNTFKKILPEVHDVDQFAGIRIHGGNTEKNSLGCLLVGFETDNKKIWKSASDALVKKLTGVKNIELEIIKVKK